VDQVIDEVLGRALLAHHRVAYLCQLRTSLGTDRRGTTFVPICLDILRRRPLYSSHPDKGPGLFCVCGIYYGYE
jgi:hypothetical protein